MTGTQVMRLDTNALNRMLVGFDSLFNDFERRFANQINNNYPPHNIIRTGENQYIIELAVSGFDTEEITVEVDQEHLVIRGERAQPNDPEHEYLYRGLATRDFVKVFPLLDHVEVKGSTIKNGILTVSLEKIIPESLKPRKIKVQEL
jgi:molecular chaperone IbpA